MHTLTYHAETLLNRLLEVTTDGHYLADRLHAGAQFLVYTAELAEIPAWYLADYIVECRLEECRSGLRNGVLQFKQSIPHTQLGSYESKRIACRLAGQC